MEWQREYGLQKMPEPFAAKKIIYKTFSLTKKPHLQE